MIKPRIGDVWNMSLTPTNLVMPVVIKDRRVFVSEGADRRDIELLAWRVVPVDHTVPVSPAYYGRSFFVSCLKRASKRKKLSPAAMNVLRDLVRRGDLNFHTSHQVARSLVKYGLAKWVTTTATGFASLHATIDGFRLVDGGGND